MHNIKKLALSTAVLFCIAQTNTFAANFACPSSGDVRKLHFDLAMLSLDKKWVLIADDFEANNNLWCGRLTMKSSAKTQVEVLKEGQTLIKKALLSREPNSSGQGKNIVCDYTPGSTEYSVIVYSCARYFIDGMNSAA